MSRGKPAPSQYYYSPRMPQGPWHQEEDWVYQGRAGEKEVWRVAGGTAVSPPRAREMPGSGGFASSHVWDPADEARLRQQATREVDACIGALHRVADFNSLGVAACPERVLQIANEVRTETIASVVYGNHSRVESSAYDEPKRESYYASPRIRIPEYIAPKGFDV
ncbi:hypothetical protein DIPPA_08916 [Diplonema papillatum]|nr:hypothetical protein DIPPA_08916 [Diplonema papillatum]